MNHILEQFLSLTEVLDSFEGRQNEYIWLLTSVEWGAPQDLKSYCMDMRRYDDYLDLRKKFIFSGEQLSELAEAPGFYIIWGVFSAFKKDTVIDLDYLSVVPFADGNTEFWIENPEIQHPDAEIELSSYILLFSKDEDISKKFQAAFTDAKDLPIYNQS